MGKFVLGPTKNGGFRFNLKAGNGEIIATSESYTSESACRNGIDGISDLCFGNDRMPLAFMLRICAEIFV